MYRYDENGCHSIIKQLPTRSVAANPGARNCHTDMPEARAIISSFEFRIFVKNPIVPNKKTNGKVSFNKFGKRINEISTILKKLNASLFELV